MAYTEEEKQEIINTICEGIAQGKALRNICNEEGQIDVTTFYKWIDDDEDKTKQYTRATTDRADSIFEDILDIADSQGDDVYKDKEGKEHVNHDNINRARLRVDARKWAASKMNPKKYGDKVINENHNQNTEIPATLEELNKEIDKYIDDK